jgi:hypothetical protein
VNGSMETVRPRDFAACMGCRITRRSARKLTI